MQRLSWNDICHRDDYHGRWVALLGCHYDRATGKATEGSVVDVDSNLAELCHRVRDSEWHNCAILFARPEESKKRARSSYPPIA